MPETKCVLPDGKEIDLSSASQEEKASCLLQDSGAVIRIEDQEVPVQKPRSRRVPMDPKPEESLAPPVAPAPPPPDSLTSTTEVPSPTTSAGELGPLKDLAGDNPALLVVLALITTVGGAAGFKLWTKVAEQKHEQQMKRLDIEQANAGLQGAQPPPCQAAHHTLLADIKALQAQVGELSARIEKAEKAASGFDPSVDVGDLEERVEVLEKTLRKKARSAQGGE